MPPIANFRPSSSDLRLKNFTMVNQTRTSTLNSLTQAGDYLFWGGTSSYLARYTVGGQAEPVPTPASGTIFKILGLDSNRIAIAIQNNGVWISDDAALGAATPTWVRVVVDNFIAHLATNNNGNVVAFPFIGTNGYFSSDNGSSFGSATPMGLGSSNASAYQSLTHHPELDLFIRLGTSQKINTSVSGSSWSTIDQAGNGYNDFQSQCVFDDLLYLGDSVGRTYTSPNNGSAITEITDRTFYNNVIGQSTSSFPTNQLLTNGSRVYSFHASTSIQILDSGTNFFYPLGIGGLTQFSNPITGAVVYDGDVWFTSGQEIFKSLRE